MPQKPVFTRYPLLSVPHAFLSCGQIRTGDVRLSRLLDSGVLFADCPETWEGVFRLACLTKNEPLKEPVVSRIRNAIRDTDSGSFNGSLEEQICIARAAFALFEYTADRLILRRIAVWCRYLEIEWEQLTSGSPVLFRPADLMELLLRLYQISGIKSLLRLCARLRSAAFDWTTVLHTFRQAVPIKDAEESAIQSILKKNPEDLDYGEKQLLINHSSLLADGMRFSLLSGLFSGNGQDLSAGKAAWAYLRKHHGAACGGTSGNPFLAGTGSDKPVRNETIAAWTEAFSVQLLPADNEWALDELVRIVFNGLADILNCQRLQEKQYINVLRDTEEEPLPTAGLYARAVRAVASAYHHAVSLTADGFRIHYLLPGNYALMIRKQPVILHTDGESITFQCPEPVQASADLFYAETETAALFMRKDGQEEIICSRKKEDPRNGGVFLPMNAQWSSGDGFRYEQQGYVISENVHHQGSCHYIRNRLLSASAEETAFAYAEAGKPECDGNSAFLMAGEVSRWLCRDGIPEDIPVRPPITGRIVSLPLQPYAEIRRRMTVFPKARTYV